MLINLKYFITKLYFQIRKNEINKLREQQKSLISDIDLERQTVAKLEAIAASLHAKQKNNDQQQFIEYMNRFSPSSFQHHRSRPRRV